MARQVIKSVGGLVLISIAMFVVSIILFILGFKKMHRYQLVADTPTSKVRSIAMGLVEVKGEAEAKQYLKSPFSKDSCIYYKYKIYEYSEHLSHDDNGKTYSWDPVGSGEKRVPFFLKDATGSVLIDPTKAEFKVPVKKAYYQKSGLFGATTIINL
ncbi:MAG: hypothetical protein GWP09_01645, partial [Nitrospiraceae bacterium]|nr:hypothetical protein [Nitrospiraceae bacterium]